MFVGKLQEISLIAKPVFPLSNNLIVITNFFDKVKDWIISFFPYLVAMPKFNMNQTITIAGFWICDNTLAK